MQAITESINAYTIIELKNFMVFLTKEDIVSLDDHEMQLLINKFKNGSVEEVQPKEVLQPKKVKEVKTKKDKEDKEAKKCEFVLQKGKNKGQCCGKPAMKGEKACKSHLEKYKEEQQRIIEDNERVIEDPETDLTLDPELEKELFGSDTSESVNDIMD